MTYTMFDFHSHTLPEMDDGSSSVEQSLQMIRESASQGVAGIVLTPHFYAESDHPKHFLEKRQRKMRLLKEQLPDGSPALYAGAEVQYYEGISEMEDLPSLRISGTRYLLVEMPFAKWTPRVIDNVLDIHTRRDFTVIIAHVERYMRWHKPTVLEHLLSEGVLLQANAEFFLRGFGSRKAFRMLENGWIHILGSDAHNMSSRPPNLESAVHAISKKCGESVVRKLMTRGEVLLRDAIPLNSAESTAEV